jgi:hypothetical protein
MLTLSPPKTFSSTTTVGIDWPAARTCGLGTVLYVISSGTSGSSYTVQLDYVSPDGSVFQVTTATGAITTDTITNCALTGSPWSTATATPLPNRITATKTSGNITLRVLAMMDL